MAKRKPRDIYLCGECGETFPQWYGRCPSCTAWSTLRAYRPPDSGDGDGGGPGVALARAHGAGPSRARPLGEVRGEELARRPTGIGEFDRALGGGLVPGSVVLIGGEPGVGKSTLLLQVAAALVREGTSVLYATAEESSEQTRLRADRLPMDTSRILLHAENELPEILAEAERSAPGAVIIDSIQTVFLPEVPSAPGSLAQVRESGMALTRWAKSRNIPVLLVGHVTKEGTLAGPKTLEHMVDTVLEMTGDPNRGYRLLQATKNRFGSVQELGVFDMRDDGLVEVREPSRLLLRDGASTTSGSVVVPTLEGTRTLLVEVQALTHPAAHGSAQRVTTGFDRRRLAILLGVLARWTGIRLGNADVFLNIAGGLRIAEPAADLGVLLAIAGSRRKLCVGEKTVVLGEVGLGGEVRSVRHTRRRLEESFSSGYTRAIVPRPARDEALSAPHAKQMDLFFVDRALQAVQQLRPVRDGDEGPGPSPASRPGGSRRAGAASS